MGIDTLERGTPSACSDTLSPMYAKYGACYIDTSKLSLPGGSCATFHKADPNGTKSSKENLGASMESSGGYFVCFPKDLAQHPPLAPLCGSPCFFLFLRPGFAGPGWASSPGLRALRARVRSRSGRGRSFPLFLAIGLAVLSSFAGAFCLPGPRQPSDGPSRPRTGAVAEAEAEAEAATWACDRDLGFLLFVFVGDLGVGALGRLVSKKLEQRTESPLILGWCPSMNSLHIPREWTPDKSLVPSGK